MGRNDLLIRTFLKYLLNNGANPNPINKRGVSLVEMVSKEIKNSKEGGEYNDECLTIKKMMIERGVKWPRS